MKTYLQDQFFLRDLDFSQNKEVYIRIISLSNEDIPLESIEGRATGGSINVDGNSAIRRSCSITMIALEEDQIITNSNWCYNTKFQLEIGLKNNIDNKYPDIVWFDMGIYIITSFSFSKSATNLSVTISGQDKMCRLNGEVSGNIPVSTNFGVLEEVITLESGERQTKITKLPIKLIIQNALREYAQENMENIVINDLQDYAYELWEYKGLDPIFLLKDAATQNNKGMIQLITNQNTPVIFANNTKATYGTFESEGGKFYSMNSLDSNYNKDATIIKYGSEECYVIKVQYGETAGYHQTPLVYNTDLVLKAGDTIVTLLDKLKKMLGDFEYFYDLHGKFIFQKKNTYVQELFSPINGDIIMPTMLKSQYSYQFTDHQLFTNISKTPQIKELKNDFTIWGSRKGATGDELPIHVRYAIDKKPHQYQTLKVNPDNEKQVIPSGDIYESSEYDWRELIYLMAKDFSQFNSKSNYLNAITEANPYFPKGKTGYEQYYSDLLGFWRQLYNPNPTSYDIKQYGEFYDGAGSDGNGDDKFWNKKIHSHPMSLNFWFDFLDTEGGLGAYSIKKFNSDENKYVNNIGIRSKVVNDTAVKSIYYKETPEILFILPDDENFESSAAYSPLLIPKNMETLFVRGSQGISAITKANELINQHTAIADSISITAIPIYYLEPNTRIYIEGYGDYILNKIIYNLSENKTMSISGSKILEQFY